VGTWNSIPIGLFHIKNHFALFWDYCEILTGWLEMQHKYSLFWLGQ
jgi:hypothetical protein